MVGRGGSDFEWAGRRDRNMDGMGTSYSELILIPVII